MATSPYTGVGYTNPSAIAPAASGSKIDIYGQGQRSDSPEKKAFQATLQNVTNQWYKDQEGADEDWGGLRGQKATEKANAALAPAIKSLGLNPKDFEGISPLIMNDVMQYNGVNDPAKALSFIKDYFKSSGTTPDQVDIGAGVRDGIADAIANGGTVEDARNFAANYQGSHNNSMINGAIKAGVGTLFAMGAGNAAGLWDLGGAAAGAGEAAAGAGEVAAGAGQTAAAAEAGGNSMYSLANGTGTFGQGSALSTGNAMTGTQVAGMGGGTGLTAAGGATGLDLVGSGMGLTSMGGGTGVTAGGINAAGATGATGANAGALNLPNLNGGMLQTPTGSISNPLGSGATSPTGTSPTSTGSSILDTLKNNSGLIGNGLGLVGGLIGGESAKQAASAQADAQLKAAQIAADAAKFRPVGVTNSFGSSNFTKDANGNVTGAGYTLSPELQAQMGQLTGVAGGMLDQFAKSREATAGIGAAGNGLMAAGGSTVSSGGDAVATGNNFFGQAQQWAPDMAAVKAQTAPLAQGAQTAMQLGQGYLSTDPKAQAQKYLDDQLALLAGSRASSYAEMQNRLQQTGRAGLSVGGGGGMTAANPEMQAYYNAQRQQDLGLAAQATQGGMDYAKFGSGLYDSGAGMLNNMYGIQAASFAPSNAAAGIGAQAANAGASVINAGANASNAGANMIRTMYEAQDAASRPYLSALNGMNTINNFGRQNMLDSMGISSTISEANARAGLLTGNGITNAANTMAPANAYNPWASLFGGAGEALKNYKWGP